MRIIKILLSITTICAGLTTSLAQDDTSSYLQEQYCDSTMRRCVRLIHDQKETPDPQEISYLLGTWERECGLNESICLGYTAIDLLGGYYATEPIQPDVLQCLLDYKNICIDTAYYGTKQSEQFDQFLRSIAEQITGPELSPNETFLKLFFEGDLDLVSISNLISTSELSQQTIHLVDSISNRSETQWSIQLGQFLPLGAKQKLGKHTTLGIGLTRRFSKYRIGVELNFKLGDADEEYEVYYQDRLTSVKDMNAFYWGFHFQYRLFGNRKHSTWLRAALGWDMLTPIQAEDLNGNGEMDTEELKLFGNNLNIGIAYELNRINSFNVVMEILYCKSTLDNHNNLGTPLDGDYIQANIGVLIPLFRENLQIWRSLNK